ncbi:MAG: GerAB/ArcD/ProY family transporter, partial [Oscillospiraceae bacterium]|nr:GerAB/ArcD/ProY family transporter [Oscillospiraceae bacterium]
MGKDTVNRRQMLSLAFVALLSPVARRFPSSLVAVSGAAAWLAAPLALLPVLIMIFFMKALLRGERSLGEVFELSLGRIAGRGVIIIVSLWLCFYGGFVLRSAAYRFTSTIYPSAGAWIFVIFSSAVCLPIAA